MSKKWKTFWNITLYIGTLSMAFILGLLMTLKIDTGIKNYDNAQHIYEADTEIVYVDREVVVIETVIEVVEIPVYLNETEPVIPHPIATHQYYLDWFEEYEEIIDDFIDEMYRQWDDSYDLAYSYNRYLQNKLDAGETLDAVEVDFMLEFQQLDFDIAAFYTWMDEEIEPWYYAHMDKFPVEPEVAE